MPENQNIEYKQSWHDDYLKWVCGFANAVGGVIYNPHIHHRCSIRLKGFDYSREGLYFVTICVQNRACLFGDVENGVMILNDMGRMVEKWYYELQNKFQDMKCREMVVMPNHFHCIVENVGTPVGATVGADLRVCPDDLQGEHIGSPLHVCPDDLQGEHIGSPLHVCPDDLQGEHIGSPLRVCPDDLQGEHIGSPLHVCPDDLQGEHIGSPLHGVVQWFKTMTTNEYIRGVKTLGWQPFNGKLWQRNYHEHIIRNEQSYQTISEYIINNPAKWAVDKFYMQ